MHSCVKHFNAALEGGDKLHYDTLSSLAYYNMRIQHAISFIRLDLYIYKGTKYVKQM